MAYFTRLPQIEYNGNNVVDIHKKLDIISTVNENHLMNYRLSDGETLLDVSYKLYGTTDYWWLLGIINDIKDVHYDVMIKDDILQTLAKQLQILKLSNLKDYILLPINSNIEYEFEGEIYEGTIIKKYIDVVSNELGQLEPSYLFEVELEDPEFDILDGSQITVTDSDVSKLRLSSTGLYENGEFVRQDKHNLNEVLETFARGIIIYKEPFYLYVDKTRRNDFVVSGVELEENGVTIIGDRLAISQKSYITGNNILEVETVNTFNVNRYGVRESSYLTRYEELVEINNSMSVIKVIKPEFVNNTKNKIVIEGI